MKISKILKIFVVILMLIMIFVGKVSAASINEIKELERGNKGYYCVQKWDGSKWIYLTYNQTFYTDIDGQKYIAYCLCPGLPGVGYVAGEKDTYQVQVKELLKDDRVWRIIKNGYPYKSVEELGLETSDDAYFATMQAINCVLRDYTLEQSKGLYSPGKFAINGESLSDIKRRGEKTLNVMYNLIDIGLNGNEKREDLLKVSIEKISEFKKENENFYSQSFKVESVGDVFDYKISKFENFPDGSYIADLQGNKKESFQKGENFKVMIPTKNIINDINGKISVKVKQKNYPVFYSSSMLEGYQDFALCNNVYSEVYESVDVYVNSNKSKLVINKIDSETKNPIQGVKFNIINSYGDKVTMSTNEKGQIVLPNQKQGEVIIKEVEAVEGYRLNNNEEKVVLNYNETKEVTMKNELQRGNIKVIKVDKENNKIKLENVKFELFNNQGIKVADGVTDKNGELFFENLLVGKYTLIETKTKEKYQLITEPIIVEVKDLKTSEIKVENKLQKGNIKILKVDKENNKIKLEGVEFELYNEQKQKVGKGKTDKNGEILFKDLVIGKYTLVEIKTNNKYELLKEMVEIEVQNEKTSIVKVENKLQKGNIKIIKTDKENNKIKLETVEFELYNEQKQKVREGKTDKNGEILFEDLVIGKYTLVETKTNNKYELLKEAVEIEVKNNETRKVKVENKLQRGNIKVIKVDKDDNEIRLEGVEFELYDEKGDKVGSKITNKKGELIFENLLIGKYTLVESNSKTGYVKSNEKILIEVENKITKEVVVKNEKEVIKEKEKEVIKVIEEKELPKTGGLNIFEKIWYILVFSTYIIILIKRKMEK